MELWGKPVAEWYRAAFALVGIMLIGVVIGVSVISFIMGFLGAIVN